MPRVSLQTAKELPPGADVVLSQELWDLVLGQLQPEDAEETTGNASRHANKAKLNGNKAPAPSRVAVAISRRYKLESTSIVNAQSPITSLVCWACLDNLPAAAIQQQQDKGKGKTKKPTVSGSACPVTRIPADFPAA